MKYLKNAKVPLNEYEFPQKILMCNLNLKNWSRKLLLAHICEVRYRVYILRTTRYTLKDGYNATPRMLLWAYLWIVPAPKVQLNLESKASKGRGKVSNGAPGSDYRRQKGTIRF